MPRRGAFEHYEIAGYGCARTYASLLRDTKGARLLETTLREEGATDKKLTKLARTVINLRARKVAKKPAEKSRGFTAAIKGMVEKVTG